MSRNLQSVNAVIEALGGNVEVAKIFRLGKNGNKAVSNYRLRDRFAPFSYLLALRALKQKGLTAAPALWGIIDPKSTKSKR